MFQKVSNSLLCPKTLQNYTFFFKYASFLSQFIQKCAFCYQNARVRDWKGYGIVQQCGTCEPLQSQTSSSRITSDLKDKIAGWHPAEREEAAELMLCVRDVILPLAKLAGR